jgi:hypothetical protein
MPEIFQLLLNAIKIAKDVNLDCQPKYMNENNIECYKTHYQIDFYKKIATLLEDVNIDDQVYNGINKTISSKTNYIDFENVKNCMRNFKLKN